MSGSTNPPLIIQRIDIEQKQAGESKGTRGKKAAQAQVGKHYTQFIDLRQLSNKINQIELEV